MIRFHKAAAKFILKQDKATALRLYHAIDQLPLGDVKRMQGTGSAVFYRLRVGPFRVLFQSTGSDILVLKVDNRGDVYKS